MKITTPQAIFHLVLLSALCVGCQADKQGTAETAEVSDATQQTGQAEAVTTVATAAVAEENYDAHPGKALHAANCISCHDSGVYTRKDRKISDFPKLLAQVTRCDANLGSRLFDEEIEQVADYLNKAYYNYEKQ